METVYKIPLYLLCSNQFVFGVSLVCGNIGAVRASVLCTIVHYSLVQLRKFTSHGFRLIRLLLTSFQLLLHTSCQVGYNIAMSSTAKAGELKTTVALYGALLDQHARSTHAGNVRNGHEKENSEERGDDDSFEIDSVGKKRRNKRSTFAIDKSPYIGFQDSLLKNFSSRKSSAGTLANDGTSISKGPCLPDEVTFNVLLQGTRIFLEESNSFQLNVCIRCIVTSSLKHLLSHLSS
jgi:hypothetical protein